MRFARRLVFVLLACLAPLAVSAACALPDLRTDERPTADGGPTEVTVSFVVVDFLGVDDLNQQINVDLYMTMSWTDPRLAGLDGCRYALGDVWFPPIMLANSSNLRQALTRGRNLVTVGAAGRVRYVQRHTGDISSYHNLRSFPFDRHVFDVNFLAPDLTPAQLKLVPDPARTRLASRLNIEGWTVNGITLTETEGYLQAIDQDASVITLGISAERDPTYYVFRLLLPLLFVVAMSWTIFWMPPERFEFQIGLVATSMLTTIAFSLSMAGKLPDLGYLTTMDKMLIWAVFLVFQSMVEALVGGMMVRQNRADKAIRIDRISRFAFPALLVGGWAVFAV